MHCASTSQSRDYARCVRIFLRVITLNSIAYLVVAVLSNGQLSGGWQAAVAEADVVIDY